MSTINKSFPAFKGKVTVIASVPTDADTFDKWAGQDGACIESAVDQHGYHNYLGKVRTCIVNALVAVGYARNKTSAENEKDVYEKEDAYVSRLVAEGLDPATLQDIADKALASAGLTFESTLRGGGSTRSAVGQKYVDSAEELQAAWADGKGTPDRTLEKIRARIPHAQIADPTDTLALARLLRDFEKAANTASLL